MVIEEVKMFMLYVKWFCIKLFLENKSKWISDKKVKKIFQGLYR